LTPHFLEHFDFKIGGYDYGVLETKVIFAGLQLGIYLIDEHKLNKQTINLPIQTEIINQITFKCFFGHRINHCHLFEENEFIEYQ
jgi:hypothetical protein